MRWLQEWWYELQLDTLSEHGCDIHGMDFGKNGRICEIGS